MKRICFNDGWEFILENETDEFNTFGFDKYSDAAGAAARFFDHSNWERITLPHDWTVSLKKDIHANTFAGAYPNSRYHRFMTERHSDVPEIFNIGWYRKQFLFRPEWSGKRIWVEFEGIFRDAIVWCNGVYLDRHTSGYTSFAMELTDHLVAGTDNSIAVRVNSDQPEGWWYEGAGIYRNVHLLIGEPVYFKYHQTIIRSELNGDVHISASIVNDTDQTQKQSVVWRIHDAEGKEIANAKKEITLSPYSETPAEAEMHIPFPELWSIDHPYLYMLSTELGDEREAISFGIRTVAFNPNHGFLLNGKVLKIHGVCLHQDFGGVGVALTDNLNEYRIRRLKEMGVNACRMHHAPSPAMLNACDRLGMLVMDETRMFGTSPEAKRQLTDIIERDRNHPCVFIWCLGNEEFSVQNDPWSFNLVKKMTRWAKALDPKRLVTYAGNNGRNFTGANAAAEVRGVNYIRNGEDGQWLDHYHHDYPDQPIIGTEEGSYVLSRGGTVNDLDHRLLASFGDVTMPWGSTPKGWVKFIEERPYLAGSFLWTGFDYRGEPNPFYYTNLASSFGTIDLCGMEKPPFYYYKAWWTHEPVLKIAPHWNFKEGDTATIAIFTNCEHITLYLNGKVIAEQEVELYDAPLFSIPFEPGVLSAEGIHGDKNVHDQLITSGETAEVRCISVLEARSGADIAIYELQAYDENGIYCPLASDEIEIGIENGRLIGVGNGDPSSIEPEQYPPQEESIYLKSFSSDQGMFTVPSKAPNELYKRYDWLEYEQDSEGFEDDFRIVSKFSHKLNAAKQLEYTAEFSGVQSYEYIEFQRLGSATEVYLNGEKIGDSFRIHGRQANNTIRPYRFYCNFKSGKNKLKIIARHEECDPAPMSGYVKIGRYVAQPSHIRLHYGKARVFVKSDMPDKVVLSLNRSSSHQ